jgi:hypothetical protein
MLLSGRGPCFVRTIDSERSIKTNKNPVTLGHFLRKFFAVVIQDTKCVVQIFQE